MPRHNHNNPFVICRPRRLLCSLTHSFPLPIHFHGLHCFLRFVGPRADKQKPPHRGRDKRRRWWGRSRMHMCNCLSISVLKLLKMEATTKANEATTSTGTSAAATGSATSADGGGGGGGAEAMDSNSEFYNTGRVGRRNALPDILNHHHSTTSTADLPDKLGALSTTGGLSVSLKLLKLKKKGKFERFCFHFRSKRSRRVEMKSGSFRSATGRKWAQTMVKVDRPAGQ